VIAQQMLQLFQPLDDSQPRGTKRKRPSNENCNSPSRRSSRRSAAAASDAISEMNRTEDFDHEDYEPSERRKKRRKTEKSREKSSVQVVAPEPMIVGENGDPMFRLFLFVIF
jgi:hypothetical protein